MPKKKKELAIQSVSSVDETALFNDVSQIIERRKYRAQAQVNHESVLMFWEVGKHIGSVLLGGERAEYGKRIVVPLAQQLQVKYGSSYEYTNVTRMIKFAARFPDFEIVVPLAQQLSWSHFIALLPIKSDEAFWFYANYQLSVSSGIPFNAFKDPYLLDVYGLKDNYLEADLEKAILSELEKFILENGRGFTYAGKQVPMSMDGDTHKLELQLYTPFFAQQKGVNNKILPFHYSRPCLLVILSYRSIL
jgi:hypothetical protein